MNLTKLVMLLSIGLTACTAVDATAPDDPGAANALSDSPACGRQTKEIWVDIFDGVITKIERDTSCACVLEEITVRTGDIRSRPLPSCLTPDDITRPQVQKICDFSAGFGRVDQRWSDGISCFDKIIDTRSGDILSHKFPIDCTCPDTTLGSPI